MKTLIRFVVLSLASLMFFGASANGEEAFPATNGGVLVGRGDVVPRPQGIMLLRVDRAAHTMRFRMTIASLAESITRSWLARDHGGVMELMRELPISGAGPTFSGTVGGLTDVDIATIDSGKAAIILASATAPSGYVVGVVEFIPSAMAMSLERIPESSSGNGRFWMTVDRATSRAMVFISWESLTGHVLGVDVHSPVDSVLGPALFSLAPTGDSLIIGSWQLSGSDLNALRQVKLVVNVRTDSFPQGELRGAIVPIEFYSAAIEPSNEVPPISGTLSGTAYGAVFLNPDQTATFAVNASVSGSSVTGLTLNRAPIGAIGPEIHRFDSSSSRPGWWEFESSPQPEADLASLRLQNLYINAHTVTQPDGEARGQLIASETNLSSTSAAPMPDGASSPALTVVESAHGRLEISTGVMSPGASLIVSNVLGQMVHSALMHSPRMSVDLGRSARGIYLLQLVADGRVVATWKGIAGGR